MHLLGRAVKRILKGGGNFGGDLVEDRIVFGDTAGMNIWPGYHTFGSTINYRHDRDESFFTQNAACLKIVLSHRTDRTSIHVQVFAGNFANDLRYAVFEIHNGTGFAQEHAFFGNTCLFCQFPVSNQVTNLAVNRHHVLRFQNVVAVQQLSRRRVTRNVNLRVALMHNSHAEFHQGVNDAVHAGFVAWNQR